MKDKLYTGRFCYSFDDFRESEKLLQRLKKLKVDGMELYSKGSLGFLIVETDLKEDWVILQNEIREHLRHFNFKDVIITERIFKKDRDFVGVSKDSNRTVMTLELVNNGELIQEYIEIHKPENIWSQILENMDAIGIQDLEIFLSGYQAFLIMDAKADFSLEKDGERWSQLPKEREWQAYVAKYQKVDPKSKATDKWQVMKQIIN